MLKSIAIGQTVFFECHKCPGKTVSGTVRDIEQNTLRTSPLCVHKDVLIDTQEPEYKFTRRSPSDLFVSEAECKRNILIRSGQIDIREVYREEIKSVKDLMIFIFTHDMEKRHNNAAYDVAFEKTNELLGFDLQALLGTIEV